MGRVLSRLGGQLEFERSWEDMTDEFLQPFGKPYTATRYHRIPAQLNVFSPFLHRRVFITIYRAWGPSKSGAAHQSANGAARRRGTALAGVGGGGGGGMGVPRLMSGGGPGAAGAGGAAATAAATRELLQQLTKTQLRAPGEIDDDDEDLVEGDVSINHSTAAQQLRSLNSELGISLQV